MTLAARMLVGAMTLAITASLAVAEPATTRPKYGCFKVTTASLNIRAKAFSNADVVATAKRGDILVKRRRFCALRGYWCPVTFGGVEGWADKAFFETAPCPPRLSEPARS
jgi:SH3-like domain-containing protein